MKQKLLIESIGLVSSFLHPPPEGAPLTLHEYQHPYRKGKTTA